jgi:hypothetical protein
MVALMIFLWMVVCAPAQDFGPPPPHVVVSLEFREDVATLNSSDLSFRVFVELNATDPISVGDPTAPEVIVRVDNTSLVSLFFKDASFRYGVRDLQRAVLAVNASSPDINPIAPFGLAATLIVLEEIPWEPPQDDYQSAVTQSDVVMGYVLTAMSLACVLLTHVVLRGKTLEDF